MWLLWCVLKMGQREVLKVLDSKPNKYFTAKEVCKKLNVEINNSTVSTSLRKLRRYGEIDFIVEDGTFLYKSKDKF